jgi:phosphate transport system permease protein
VIVTSGTDIEASRPIAYGTALVLIAIVFFINLIAAFLRRFLGKNSKE